VNLRNALGIVVADIRNEFPEKTLSLTQAIGLARKLDHGDVIDAVDNPTTAEAYHIVLDASQTEITNALR
jgi:hypothetical protein